MIDTAITVKGTRDGLLVTIESGEWSELLAQVKALFENRNTFFRGGKVALQVKERKLLPADIVQMRQLIESNGVTVWAILSTDPDTRTAVETVGLVADLPGREVVQEETEDAEEPLLADTGILVHRTLRSGQVVTHAGHVVIVGDVHPGAEIVAGGDVIVWGRLRGIVHAGAGGDEQRSVCALELSPTQLRIGNHIARPPEDKRRSRTNQPERAFISDGQLVAERWK